MFKLVIKCPWIDREADNILVVSDLFSFPSFQCCWRSPAASLLAILFWPFCYQVIEKALNSSLWDLSGHFNLQFRTSSSYNPTNQHIQNDPQLSVHFSPKYLLSFTVGKGEHGRKKKNNLLKLLGSKHKTLNSYI